MASYPTNSLLKGTLRLLAAAFVLFTSLPSAWAFVPLGPPDREAIEYPQDQAPSPREIALGKRLFFDPRLSFNRSQSCATCHQPQQGWGDGKALGQGAKGLPLTRNVPPLYNLAWNRNFFWDGRAKSLEEQSLGPITSPAEMNQTLETLLPLLNSVPDYQTEFRALYGPAGATAPSLAQALAAFERSLILDDSPLDRFVTGDANALTPAQQRGKRLFETKARCVLCHDGPNLTDNGFHNIGLKGADPGRQAITLDTKQQGAFKTPSLRNTALTAPYMHDGSLASLEAVLDFYNQGGEATTNLDPDIRPLKLSRAELADLKDFLQSLTQDLVIDAPSLP